jgi:hypothetical protein
MEEETLRQLRSIENRLLKLESIVQRLESVINIITEQPPINTNISQSNQSQSLDK